MNKKPFDSVKLRKLIIQAIVVLVIVAAGGAYYGGTVIEKAKANTVGAIDVKNSADIDKLRQELSAEQSNINNAQNLTFSKSDKVAEKAKVIIDKYAQANFIKVSDVSEVPQPSYYASKNSLPADVTPKYIRLTFTGEFTSDSFVKFLRGIESNLPKMNVTGINVSRLDATNQTVQVDPIVVEVYTR